MCGISGYSLSPDSSVERTLAAQALLAGIAERGADAAGYAYRIPGDGRVRGHKQRSGASALLESVELPPATSEALLHVRDYTKGHPTIAANNHPVRHGAADARDRRALHRRQAAEARGRRGQADRPLARPRGLERALPARPAVRGAHAPGRPRSRRGRLLPAAPRRPRSRLNRATAFRPGCTP